MGCSTIWATIVNVPFRSVLKRKSLKGLAERKRLYLHRYTEETSCRLPAYGRYMNVTDDSCSLALEYDTWPQVVEICL